MDPVYKWRRIEQLKGGAAELRSSAGIIETAATEAAVVRSSHHSGASHTRCINT